MISPALEPGKAELARLLRTRVDQLPALPPRTWPFTLPADAVVAVVGVVSGEESPYELPVAGGEGLKPKSISPLKEWRGLERVP